MTASLNWIGYKFIEYDGYGRYGINMIRALTRLGVDVTPGLAAELSSMPGWMQRLRGMDFTNLTIQCLPAIEAKPVPGRSWILSMTEDSGCPKDWPEQINQIASRLVVPCEQNAKAFKDKGVRVPISVIPGGTEPAEFPVLEAPRRPRPYTFLALGDRPPRKGTELAWCAFMQAFPNEKDVRLIIKSRPVTMPILRDAQFTDRRIHWWACDVDTMADVYAQADCFVFPSYGEGWGMPPREAAMSGLPVIATRYGGLEVGIDHWAIPVNEYRMMPSLLPHEDTEWAECDLNELARHMRWCYEHQDKAREKGAAAAKWLRTNQTWEHSAKALLELIEQEGAI